jgi:sulfite exporter TauE/SafE
MTVLEQISNPYLASLILGLIYGLTFCTTACLPYLVSYIAGIKAGFHKGVIVTTTYNAGRITAYAIIGSVIGLFTTFFDNTFFNAYKQLSSIIFGFIIIVIGISILFKKSSINACVMKTSKPQGMFRIIQQRFDVRAFSMGFTRGFILCPALVALLLYAVTQSQVNLTVIAVLFGLGTALSPMFFLGGAIGWLLEKAPFFRKWTSIFGGAFLILLGSSVLLLAILEISKL